MRNKSAPLAKSSQRTSLASAFWAKPTIALSSSSRSKPKSRRCRTVLTVTCAIVFLLVLLNQSVTSLGAEIHRSLVSFSLGCGREIGEGLLWRVYKGYGFRLADRPLGIFPPFLACDFAKDVYCRLHGRDVVHGQLRDLPVGEHPFCRSVDHSG